MNLTTLNAALNPHGWHAEFSSSGEIMLGRPQGGQLHDRFDFDPSDSNDNGPWENDAFPADDTAVDRALLALCKEAQA